MTKKKLIRILLTLEQKSFLYVKTQCLNFKQHSSTGGAGVTEPEGGLIVIASLGGALLLESDIEIKSD